MSPVELSRENPVVCIRCFVNNTWNNDAICNGCKAKNVIKRLQQQADEIVELTDEDIRRGGEDDWKARDER